VDPAPIWRPTARLLVLDSLDRVLLFSADDPGADGALRFLPVAKSHDVAFDTGMLTADLKIHIAQPLADAPRGDHLTRQYYRRPPLLDTLLLPDDAERPGRRYLD
jgi:hypothetical protein